jgi:hypothetical protein
LFPHFLKNPAYFPIAITASCLQSSRVFQDFSPSEMQKSLVGKKGEEEGCVRRKILPQLLTGRDSYLVELVHGFW